MAISSAADLEWPKVRFRQFLDLSLQNSLFSNRFACHKCHKNVLKKGRGKEARTECKLRIRSCSLSGTAFTRLIADICRGMICNTTDSFIVIEVHANSRKCTQRSRGKWGGRMVGAEKGCSTGTHKQTPRSFFNLRDVAVAVDLGGPVQQPAAVSLHRICHTQHCRSARGVLGCTGSICVCE